MTEGQKVHRLLGVLYADSKKSVFYPDLAESFNDGLWFGKIDEKEIAKLCDILVRDELAHYIGGNHAASATPSDRDSSKGIAITNNAFTAYINKKYIEGAEPSPVPKIAMVAAGVLLISAIAYIIYLKNDVSNKLSRWERDYEEVELQKERAFNRLDSVVRTKDSLISKQAARIKDLEQKLAAKLAPPPKKTNNKATKRKR